MSFHDENPNHSTQAYWWKGPEDANDEDEACRRATDLFESVRSLEHSQRDAHEQHLWNARLYSNRELAHFDWGHGTLYQTSLTPVSTYGENLTKSVVDTMVSVIGKTRTKVTPVPRGQNYSLYLQTRRLDKWLYGEFMRLNLFAKARQVFKDACVFGFGVVKVEHEPGCGLTVRRVFPDDLIIDQAEVTSARDGRPRHVYERRCMRVEEVESRYGLEQGTLSRDAPDAVNLREYLSYRSPGRGWVIVVEAYRMASDDGPGRHTVACNGVLLHDEEWNHEWCPYVWYHFDQPVDGFYWPGVVENVLPYQIRLNEINDVIRDAQDIMGRPRLLVAEGSRVNPADLDNLVARIIKYTGIKPEAVTWPAISAELYNERERQIRACYEQFGLMQLVAQGRLPNQARLDSAPALQEATTISDDRLAEPLMRFEEFHLDLAKTMIRVMRLSGEDAETVWYTGGRLAVAENIRWKDIDLDDTSYVLTLEASSVFSMTPAARRDKLERWLDKGIITLPQYLEMENTPDIDSFSSLQSAASEDISRVIGLLEEGKYENPHPMQDLVNGVERVTMGYLRLSRYTDVPTKVRTNFVKWVTQARAILNIGRTTEGQGGVSGTMPAPADPMAVAGGTPAATLPGAGVGPTAPLGAAPPLT